MDDAIACFDVGSDDFGIVEEYPMTAATDINLHVASTKRLYPSIAEVVGVHISCDHMVQQDGCQSFRVNIR